MKTPACGADQPARISPPQCCREREGSARRRGVANGCVSLPHVCRPAYPYRSRRRTDPSLGAWRVSARPEQHPIRSAAWRSGPVRSRQRHLGVHSEFPGMLSGGLCALMLQLLHPRALAGVYDHSNFRADLVGRLRRTTNFVAGTTYAPRAEAEQLIARVRNIHAHIRGHTADGVAYDANDPELLTWVHVTEAYGFLQGCRRYCRDVPTTIADQYYDITTKHDGWPKRWAPPMCRPAKRRWRRISRVCAGSCAWTHARARCSTFSPASSCRCPRQVCRAGCFSALVLPCCRTGPATCLGVAHFNACRRVPRRVCCVACRRCFVLRYAMDCLRARADVCSCRLRCCWSGPGRDEWLVVATFVSRSQRILCCARGWGQRWPYPNPNPSPGARGAILLRALIPR